MAPSTNTRYVRIATFRFRVNTVLPNLAGYIYRSGDMSTHSALIVDDDKRYLSACARLVHRRGFKPILAPTFSEAQPLVSAEAPPEAILIDVTLNSGHSGITLRDSLLHACKGRSSIALMSAYPQTPEHEVLDKSAVYKIDDFLVRAAVFAVTRFHPTMSMPVILFARQHCLPPQEARILAQLFIGTTRTSLSKQLGISENTVKSQVRQLLRRLQAVSVDHLIARLLRFSYDVTRSATATEPFEQSLEKR